MNRDVAAGWRQDVVSTEKSEGRSRRERERAREIRLSREEVRSSVSVNEAINQSIIINRDRLVATTDDDRTLDAGLKVGRQDGMVGGGGGGRRVDGRKGTPGDLRH